jgi:glycosyltransferase involved in cell wall biosynthesis
VTYVGSYDWRGERYRRHHLSPSLEEIDVPLGDALRRARPLEKLQQRAHHHRRRLSTHGTPIGRVRAHAQTNARRADVVVFSHPWVYPLVRKSWTITGSSSSTIRITSRPAARRAHGRPGICTELVKHVVSTEFELAHRADLILACSHEDADLFRAVYGVSADRLREIPNGVFSQSLTPPTADEACGQARLDLSGPASCFWAAPTVPTSKQRSMSRSNWPRCCRGDVRHLRGVGDAAELAALRRQAPPRVRFTGLITDAEKAQYLRAADVAVNPMFSGSGTNIKMFDFGAAGVPVVATPVERAGSEATGRRLRTGP